MIHCIGESHTEIFGLFNNFKIYPIRGINATHIKNKLDLLDNIIKNVNKELNLILFIIDKFKKLELHLYENSIETRKMFPPMIYHKHYSNEKCDISNSKIIYESTLITKFSRTQ